MGRTIPPSRMALAAEKEEWKPFRNAISKSDRKKFDEMWDIPRLYVSACSNSVQLVPLHAIIMSILFHHYKELKKCVSEVEQLQGKVNSSSNDEDDLTIKEEEQQEEKEAPATTLDGYFHNNMNFKSLLSYS